MDAVDLVGGGLGSAGSKATESAARMAATDGGLGLLAVRAGYADQSHLTRECVRLTGVPPRVLLAETRRSCARGHDHAASSTPVLRGRAGVPPQPG